MSCDYHQQYVEKNPERVLPRPRHRRGLPDRRGRALRDPVVILTSDEDDMQKLCGKSARIVPV